MISVDKQLKVALKLNILKTQIRQLASHLMRVYGEMVISELKII